MIKKMMLAIALLGLMVVCIPCYVGASIDGNGGKGDSEYSKSISDSRFKECITRYICEQLQKEESDIIVSKLKVRGNRKVPDGVLNVELNCKANGRLIGYVRMNAIIFVDDVEVGTVQLYSWVDVFESMVCASRDLKRKDVIRKDDVHLMRKNTSHMSGKTIRDMGEVVGMMVRNNVKAGSCIKEWMVERAPVVERGDLVTILAESGDLKVTVPGRILERGYQGDLVRVQNSLSKKEIYAEVVNGTSVIVSF